MGKIITDNLKFQKKYGFDQGRLTKKKLRFRMELLEEEVAETFDAFQDGDIEEWIDGHIDLIVIAVGNLSIAGVDVQKAWDEVYRANMSKVRGIKPTRKQSDGWDIVKPEGWKAPDHSDNYGDLEGILTNEKD